MLHQIATSSHIRMSSLSTLRCTFRENEPKQMLWPVLPDPFVITFYLPVTSVYLFISLLSPSGDLWLMMICLMQKLFAMRFWSKFRITKSMKGRNENCAKRSQRLMWKVKFELSVLWLWSYPRIQRRLNQWTKQCIILEDLKKKTQSLSSSSYNLNITVAVVKIYLWVSAFLQTLWMTGLYIASEPEEINSGLFNTRHNNIFSTDESIMLVAISEL